MVFLGCFSDWYCDLEYLKQVEFLLHPFQPAPPLCLWCLTVFDASLVQKGLNGREESSSGRSLAWLYCTVTSCYSYSLSCLVFSRGIAVWPPEFPITRNTSPRVSVMGEALFSWLRSLLVVPCLWAGILCVDIPLESHVFPRHPFWKEYL